MSDRVFINTHAKLARLVSQGRKERGLSVQELATLANVTPEYVLDLEAVVPRARGQRLVFEATYVGCAVDPCHQHLGDGHGIGK